MRIIVILVFVHFSSALLAQSTLESVSVQIRYEDDQFQISQTLHLNLSGSTETVTLKALKFDGLTIGAVDIPGLRYSQVHKDELIEIQVEVAPSDSIQLSYAIKTSSETFYLPLFFTNLSAASSDDGFFKMDLISSSKFIHVHFPTVEIRETIEGGTNRTSFELPALISGVRLELLNDSESPRDIVAIVDWSVALLFTGIGFLIWYNRKKLIHG